jgi:hypothetical protein
MSRAVNVCWIVAVKGSLHWWNTDGTDEHHVKGTVFFEALVNPLASVPLLSLNQTSESDMMGMELLVARAATSPVALSACLPDPGNSLLQS